MAAGGINAQRDEEHKAHPIQYESRTINPSEQKYYLCKRERLGVVYTLYKFRVYLLSTKPTELLTHQQALKAGLAGNDIHGHLAWWIEFFAEYELDIWYCNRVLNRAADFLSRMISPRVGLKSRN